jgi:hypothetical protein
LPPPVVRKAIVAARAAHVKPAVLPLAPRRLRLISHG